MKLKLLGRKTLIFSVVLLTAAAGTLLGTRQFGITLNLDLSWLPFGMGTEGLRDSSSSEDLARELRPSITDLDHAAGSEESSLKKFRNVGGGGRPEPDELTVSGAPGRTEDGVPEGSSRKFHDAADNSAKDESTTQMGSQRSEHGGDSFAELPYVPPASLQSGLIGQVRQLQMVQERLAKGDASAVKEQKNLLVGIGQTLSGFAVDKANAAEIYSAVTYLLSGGRPDVVEHILTRKDLPIAVRNLLVGAIAYVKGDAQNAGDHLRNLDPLQFGRGISGHLAMVQASVVEDLTQANRRRLLELAANSMLGTLVEEAALRRIIEQSASGKDVDGFILAADRYHRRFARSLYNAEYMSALIEGILRFETDKSALSPDQLDTLIFFLPPERRNDILQALSEAGLRKGFDGLCRYASGRLRRLAAEGSVTWTRASLYYFSCSIAAKTTESVSSLKSLDLQRLDSRDRQLARSAILLAERAALADASVLDPKFRNASNVDLTDEQLAFQGAVRAEIAKIDQLIKESTQ
jgi:chemotaxis protein MotC